MQVTNDLPYDEKIRIYEKRFWSRVDFNGPPHPERPGCVRQPVPTSKCWVWTGRLCKGYGRFDATILHRPPLQSHRIALFGLSGPNLRDSSIHAAHTCDNSLCVRPEHLFLCTNSGNIADRDAKGRGAMLKGSAHGGAKLADSDVLEICARLDNGELPRVVCKDFGISRRHVYGIKTGRTWGHLTGRQEKFPRKSPPQKIKSHSRSATLDVWCA